MTRSRNILPPRAYWSKAEVRILRKRYPHDLEADVAAALGRPLRGIYQKAKELGLKKSAKFLASDLSKRIKRGKQHPAMIATRFQRGHVPANKGLRRPGWHVGRMRERVKKFAAEEMQPGFRLMTKREFFDHCVAPPQRVEDDDGETYLQSFAMPGGDDFDA